MRLMVKMGRESLTRRVAVCNPGHVPLVTAHKVNDVLSGFTLQQVQDVSKSASIFFAWVFKSYIYQYAIFFNATLKLVYPHQ